MEKEEIWLPVVGYEDRYEVSNLGHIRNMKGLYLTYQYNHGYIRVALSRGGKVRKYLLHRLVYQAFNGPIPEGMHINHMDENIKNNAIYNLNLLTPKENVNWGTCL